jgi:hypothetical protein
VGLSEEALKAAGLSRNSGAVPNYGSDSGMSEAGPMPRPGPGNAPAPPLPLKRKQITGSSVMHVSARPSMLSADRIALTQHSGAQSGFL